MVRDILRVLSRALRTALGNPGVVLPILLVPSIVLGLADTFVFERLDVDQGAEDSNIQIFKVALAWMGTALAMEVTYGPIIAATAVYLGRGQGKPTLYGALNYALNRYGRIFKWHALAFLLINLGMIVVLPGILYQLRYAFVDAVCCVEEEAVAARPQHAAHEGSKEEDLLIFLPYFVYVQVAMLAYLALVDNWIAIAGLHLATYVVLFVFAVAMYVLYEDRTSTRARTATDEHGPAPELARTSEP